MEKKRKYNCNLITVIIMMMSAVCACDYLDVVPDNIPTVEENFNMRVSAERYLFTCYRYLPTHGYFYNDPSIATCDEYWFLYPYITSTNGNEATSIARGLQNTTDPYMDFWNKTYGNCNPFKGIRDCNIFLEHIDGVPDMFDDEKARWSAEAKFLKAYYHFWLFRMYGPIPVIKENLPVSAGVNTVKTYREPVDACVDYMVELLDEAALDLPEIIYFEAQELGRITKSICLSLKALILVTAASPLFNGGSSDYESMVDNRGIKLFNSNPDLQKWKRAADACANAISLCEAYYKLYTWNEIGAFGPTIPSDSTKTLIALRNVVTEKWNCEIIWANTQSTESQPQQDATPYGVMLSQVPGSLQNTSTLGRYSPPIKIAEMYYSRNGLPISEDKTYPYADRFKLREATSEEWHYVQPGYTTVGLHFDREPRFYASLAFDGGLWLGQGATDANNPYLIQCKAEQLQVSPTTARQNVTGYWPKKLVNHASQPGLTGGYTIISYPWPVIRLADLYLLYAEALNEFYGPQGDPNGTTDRESPYTWLNKVRERAGIPAVGDAWDNYSNNPNKYKQQASLREIIQQERLIELAFEGHRIWDLKRWRLAHVELNKPITGWDYNQKSPEFYYRQRVLFNQSFMTRDYFWPIRENELLVNRNLVQNYGY